MALGASSWLVRRGIPIKTLRLALHGVAHGTLGSFLMSRWIESLLFGTAAANPAVFSGVSLLLCAVALVAAYVPVACQQVQEPSADVLLKLPVIPRIGNLSLTSFRFRSRLIVSQDEQEEIATPSASVPLSSRTKADCLSVTFEGDPL
jgi:hypothetical protein